RDLIGLLTERFNMKKIWLIALLVLGIMSLRAEEPVLAMPLVDGGKVEWSCFQAGVWPFYIFAPGTNIYGLNMNLAANYSMYNSAGVNLAPVNYLGYENYALTLGVYNVFNGINHGVSVGVVNKAENNYAIQFGVVNLVKDFFADSTNILQIGLYNQAESGLQLGLLNYNPNAWIAYFPLFNFSRSGEAK
ncbi:MAG: hypothetical protein RRY34_09955, partial [Victivallaceae bacterium]